jgi:hypothetical protein
VKGVSRRVRFGFGAFIAAGLILALVLAFFVSPSASGDPDGLNKVAIDEGFADTERDHALGDAPTAGYEVRGVGNDRMSAGLAGVIGVAVTFAAAGGAMLVVRRARRTSRVRAVPN